MLKKLLFIAIFLFIPLVILSQEGAAPATEEKKSSDKSKVKSPIQAVYNEEFTVRNIDFSTRSDPKGRGIQLEVNIDIFSKADYDQDLYVFIIASHEDIVMKETSFGVKTNIPDRIDIKMLEAYPKAKKEFEYEKDGKVTYIKYPKNIAAGVDPDTGKPFKLEERIHIRTYYLSRYRKRYRFYNAVTILIFDKDKKLAYRQVYGIKGVRK